MLLSLDAPEDVDQQEQRGDDEEEDVGADERHERLFDKVGDRRLVDGQLVAGQRRLNDRTQRTGLGQAQERQRLRVRWLRVRVCSSVCVSAAAGRVRHGAAHTAAPGVHANTRDCAHLGGRVGRAHVDGGIVGSASCR